MSNYTYRPDNLQRGLNALVALFLLCTLGAGLAILKASPAQAAPARQIPIYTPTPGPDGQIIYIVKANDTLLGIALTFGISIDELRQINGLSGDTIFEGQKILLGLAGPPEITVTAGPTLTPTPVLPTATPKPGIATLCILLFDDVNGDSLRQESEISIPGGAISFNNRTGSVSEAFDSAPGEEPQCFENLPEGSYSISVAVPEGYNPTTEASYLLELKPGDETYINFGAQANTKTLAEAPVIPAPEGGRSPILGIIGGLLLLAGIGVAIFAGRVLRSK